MDKTPIKFSELINHDDCSSIVLMGTIFKSDEDYDQVEELMKQIRLIPNTAKVVGVHQIIGNVRGDRMEDDSMKNWLIETNSCNFNCMARLMYGDTFKWTSDFITNYESWYKL